MSDRKFPLVKVRENVVCQSSRNNAHISLIVVHDTEGANLPGIADLKGLAAYFDKPTTQASSHVATDAEGQSARMVPDDRKAWHVAYYNSASLGIEQIGFATQKAWTVRQQKETARWLAYWSRKHGIPLQKGKVAADGLILRAGVVRHSELGNLGGGHHDPGEAYPLHQVLEYARHYRTLQNKG